VQSIESVLLAPVRFTLNTQVLFASRATFWTIRSAFPSTLMTRNWFSSLTIWSPKTWPARTTCRLRHRWSVVEL